ncbi:MAG: hypothetical protein WBH90_00220 [Aggregatilineales bacterium]
MCDDLTDVERAVLEINGSLERRLFVIAGPSGVGKNTIIKELLASYPRIMDRVRTYTTRPPREDEVYGQQYYFVTVDEFKELAIAGQLLEADRDNPLGHDVYDTEDCYSMPMDIFRDVSPEAHLVVAEVDVAGAALLKKKIKNCVTIFVTAPPHVLVERIRKRPDKTMDDQTLQQRLEKAKTHINAAKTFDYIVYNAEGRLTQAVQAIKNIIHAERMRPPEGFDLAHVLPPDAWDFISDRTHENQHE